MKLKGRERKRSWSEYPGICLEKAEENQGKKKLRTTGFEAEVLTRHLPNVKQEYKPSYAITFPRLHKKSGGGDRGSTVVKVLCYKSAGR